MIRLNLLKSVRLQYALSVKSENRNTQYTRESHCLESEYLSPSPDTFLQRELILLFDDARLAKTGRVLEYLAQVESRELDPWLQDDLRVAWCTVLYAARGYEKPWELAFSCYYGKHPSKAIPIWLERWAERDRKLGPGLTEETAVLPPRKPVQSVRPVKKERAS